MRNQKRQVLLKRLNRRSQFETLESRRMLAAAWRNPVDAFDVDQNRVISPIDALIVINDIARRDVGTLPSDKLDPEEAFYDVSGDGTISPLDALRVINAIARNGDYTLREANKPATEFSVIVGLGQSAGSRTYQFAFDTIVGHSAVDVSSNDVFAVYLRDIESPSTPLLPGRSPAEPLFSIHGASTSYEPGLVRYDGQVVEIDLTEVTTAEAGHLVFQLINGDADVSTSVAVTPLSNDVELITAAAPRLNAQPQIAEIGAPFELAEMTAAPQLEFSYSEPRFDRSTGVFRALVNVTNTGAAVGRDVAMVLTGLPESASVLNASGTTGDEFPYLSFREAIRPGGLGRQLQSDFLELAIQLPANQTFDLSSMALAGVPNREPVLTAPATIAVEPGEKSDVQFTASDPDGDPLRYAIRSNGSLAGSMSAGGLLTLTPRPEDVGQHQVTVQATDGLLSAEATFEIVVTGTPVSSTEISGEILDAEGTPIPGLEIEVEGIVVESGSDGAFTLSASTINADSVMMIRNPVASQSSVAEFQSASALTDTQKNYPTTAIPVSNLLGHDPYAGFGNTISKPIYLTETNPENSTEIDLGVPSTKLSSATTPGFSVSAPTSSIREASGDQFTGSLNLSELKRDRTPAPIPRQFRPEFVGSIGTPDLRFSSPAAVSIPNRLGWAPGTYAQLWSSNPKTGEPVNVGLSRVSVDGKSFESFEGGLENGGQFWLTSYHTKTVDQEPNELASALSALAIPVYGPQLPTSLRAEGEDTSEQERESDEEDAEDETPEGGCPCDKATESTGSEVELLGGVYREYHTLATYQSNGVSRGISLHYDSLRAAPRSLTSFSYKSEPQQLQDAKSYLVAETVISGGGIQQEIGSTVGGGLGEHFWSLEDHRDSTEGIGYGERTSRFE